MRVVSFRTGKVPGKTLAVEKVGGRRGYKQSIVIAIGEGGDTNSL